MIKAYQTPANPRSWKVEEELAWLLLLELRQPLANPPTALPLFWGGQDFIQFDSEEQISALSVYIDTWTITK